MIITVVEAFFGHHHCCTSSCTLSLLSSLSMSEVAKVECFGRAGVADEEAGASRMTLDFGVKGALTVWIMISCSMTYTIAKDCERFSWSYSA